MRIGCFWRRRGMRRTAINGLIRRRPVFFRCLEGGLWRRIFGEGRGFWKRIGGDFLLPWGLPDFSQAKPCHRTARSRKDKSHPEMNQRSQAFGEARGGSRESGGFGIDELVRADAFARHLSESGRILEGMGTLKGNQEEKPAPSRRRCPKKKSALPPWEKYSPP